MQKEAVVLAVTQGTATVAVKQRDACAGCHAVCVGCSRTLQANAVNTVGACVGDAVRLESSTVRIVAMAVSVFLLPCIFAFLGYALGVHFAWRTSLTCLFALLWGGCSFGVGAALWNRSLRRRPDLRIVEILNSQQAENGAWNG